MQQITPAGLLAGSQLAFDVTGTTGPAVVQLHGLTSSRARDALLGLDLTRRLREPAVGPPVARVLRYDARGHGRSSAAPDPADFTWPRLAEDLLALADHVFPGERVHTVGPSMGTATQLYAALAAPERFASLTLALPPTAWATRAQRAAAYEESARSVELDGPTALEDPHAVEPPAAPTAPTTHPDVRAGLLPSVLRGAALSNLPAPETLADITVPALVLAWIDDAGHPVETAEVLHDVLPRSALQIARTPRDVLTWPTHLIRHVTTAA